MNYPVFLPQADLFVASTCSGIAASDAGYARGVAAQLNTVIAEQVSIANVVHPNDFEVVDISGGFGPNPLCPVADSDRYFVNIPDGVLGRLLDRIFDTSQLPGAALAGATDPATLAACAAAWIPGADCYVDDYLELFIDWFQTPEGLEVLKSQLATVDPGVAPGDVDGARLENFRGLFHPNAAAYEVIACNVLAVYDGSDTSACVPAQVSPLAKRLFNGSDITDRFPKTIVAGQSVDFEFNGFEAGSTVRVVMQSDTIELGSFTVDAAGEIAGNLVMPVNTPGVHEVIFMGIGDGGTDRFITVLVDYGGLPVPGEMYGLYFDGFEPFEDVSVEYLGGLYGRFRSDETGAVYFEVPVPDYAAIGDVPLTVSSATSPPATTAITSVPQIVDPCDGAVATVEGTAGSDVLFGTSGDDVIVAGGGNDAIFAGGGDDLICAGDGNDLIFGAGGADVIVTGDGTNVVFAGSGDDVVTGGSGNDLVFAGNGDDTVDGGDGYDHVNGGPGDDSCVNAESVTSC